MKMPRKNRARDDDQCLECGEHYETRNEGERGYCDPCAQELLSKYQQQERFREEQLTATEAKLAEIRKELEDEKRTWQCEIHSEKLADNIVKEHYARGRVNGIEVAEQILSTLTAKKKETTMNNKTISVDELQCVCGNVQNILIKIPTNIRIAACSTCHNEWPIGAVIETAEKREEAK